MEYYPTGEEGKDGMNGPDGRGRGLRGRGKAQPVQKGPWRGRGLKGRGIPPGFHFNYTEDEGGSCVYIQDSKSSEESSDGGKKKKKKKHRKKSYSSR